MIFWIKKIVAPFFQPLTVSIALLLIGCAMIWWRKRPTAAKTDDGESEDGAVVEVDKPSRAFKRGRLILSAGLLWLVLVACTPMAGCLLSGLEYTYPAIQEPTSHLQAQHAKTIVVLGGGHTQDPTLPATCELNLVTLARVVEAVRLHTALPETTIIFSGGAVYKTKPNAEIMAEAAISLGIPQDRVRTSTSARDTKGEARAIAKEIGDTPFILVTSASHMPRAVGLFRGVGLDPIPSPTGHRSHPNTDDPGMSVGQFFPGSGRIMGMERAIHEHLGILWAKLRKQL